MNCQKVTHFHMGRNNYNSGNNSIFFHKSVACVGVCVSVVVLAPEAEVIVVYTL